MAKFCKYCGAKISDDAIFCHSCGKRLTNGVFNESISVNANENNIIIAKESEPKLKKENSSLPIVIVAIVCAAVGIMVGAFVVYNIECNSENGSGNVIESTAENNSNELNLSADDLTDVIMNNQNENSQEPAVADISDEKEIDKNQTSIRDSSEKQIEDASGAEIGENYIVQGNVKIYQSSGNLRQGGSDALNDKDGYILPESDTRIYSIEELEDYDASVLRLARNEIYARHGRMFKDEEVQNYFNAKSWYVGKFEPVEFDKFGNDMLSDIEKENTEVLKEVEDLKK